MASAYIFVGFALGVLFSWMQVRKLQQANADQAATIKKQLLLIVDLVEVLQADDDDITLIYDDRRGQLKINRKAPKPPCAYR